MDSKLTIKQLFNDEEIHFRIPTYQRAYSWGKTQIEQFLDDIKEQNHEKKYFFGHFLFERENEHSYWIVDGQQRLTTIVIFISCLIAELEKRDTHVETWRIRELYIKFDRNYKFETVNYDNLFFQQAVLENKTEIAATSSAKRILNAKKYFSDEIEKADTDTLLKWKSIIDKAETTNFMIEGPDARLQATQIFAFQNDRGKKLSTLEKLKAYLMHKLYAVSDSKIAESQIRNIEELFSEIYRLTERINICDEDEVLRFHTSAYLSAWETPLDSVKKTIDNINDNKEKEEWILSFAADLKESFAHIEEIEKKEINGNSSVADILILNRNDAIPFLLKMYHFHYADSLLLYRFAEKLEKIFFKLLYTTEDHRANSIPELVLKYDGNTEELERQLDYYNEHGFRPWWRFNASCKSYFTTFKYHYHKSTRYVLWKYENFLREQNRTRLMTASEFKNKCSKKNLDNTLDHITPQNPPFTEYSQEFRENCLNNIGNLTLMVWGDNSEKRNKNPVDEVSLYDSEWYSHKEIRDVLNDKKQWAEQEINERAERIIEFIIKQYGLEK